MAIPDIAIDDGITDVEATRAPRRFLRAVLGNRKATAGAVILLVMAFVAAFPGLIAPDDPQAADLRPERRTVVRASAGHDAARSGRVLPARSGARA